MYLTEINLTILAEPRNFCISFQSYLAPIGRNNNVNYPIHTSKTHIKKHENWLDCFRIYWEHKICLATLKFLFDHSLILAAK